MKWSSPEYIHHDKDLSWYFLIAMIVIIIVIISLWQRNFLFAVFTIIAAATLIAWARRQPNIIHFELDGNGLKIENDFYPKEVFTKFAVKNIDAQWSKLLLQKKHKIAFDLVIPVPVDNIDSVRSQCLNLWTETEYQESLVDELAEWLRF
jgi:hypothetical protein